MTAWVGLGKGSKWAAFRKHVKWVRFKWVGSEQVRVLYIHHSTQYLPKRPLKFLRMLVDSMIVLKKSTLKSLNWIVELPQ
ncbi:hypothetical protein HanRHA438_Chr11g0531261 [Helianthus annuus]|nr:hypothetical protein HanRHA438_Chr11g0531261 [Helianthus annuus]